MLQIFGSEPFPETYYLNLGENDFKIENNFQILTSGNKDNIEF